MKRTLTTRDESGQTKTVEKPYPPVPQRMGRQERKRDAWERNDVLPAGDGPEVSQSLDAPSLKPVSLRQDAPIPHWWDKSGLVLGAANLRLWTKLTTRFSSPSLPGASWADSPRLSAPVKEAGYVWVAEEGGGVVVRLGLFEDRLTLNSQAGGGVFVKERVELRGGYLEAGLEYFALEWLRLDGSFGGFHYGLKTSVETNAPLFVYEGVSGNRTVGIVGFGGALETPWRFPVRLYAGGRLYFPFNPLDADEELLETAFGQGNVGLKWLF